VALKRVDPERLHYVASLQSARRFPEVLETVRALEQTRRAAALLRAQPEREVDFTPELKRLLRV
jgi:hypothetical protein